MSITRRAVLGGLCALPALRVARAAEAVTYLFPAPAFLPAFLPHQLAMKRGYFSAAGLDVTFQTGRGGADVAKQVAVGNADLGGGVGETSMIVRPNGLPVRGVALLGGKPLYQVVTRKDAGITGLIGLRHRKIGVISYQDTGYYSLLGALAAVELHKTDLEIQSVGPAGMTQLMISGSLDAIMAVPEWSVEIENAGVPLDYFPIDSAFPAMAQAVLTSDQLIHKRPGVVKGVAEAIVHAVRDCVADPVKAVADYVSFVPQQAGKERLIETILRRYVSDVYPPTPPTTLGHFDPDRLSAVQRFFVDNKIVQGEVPVAELYSNDFIG